MDSAASHNRTGDLANLSIHSEYDGTNEVILCDDSGLTISHIGSLELHSPKCNFILRDTLCVPNLSKNLISVHHLTNKIMLLLNFTPFISLWGTRSRGRFYFEGHVKMVSTLF